MREFPDDWTKCECGCNLPPDRDCPICKSDGSMQKAGIAVDNWKVPVFEEIIQEQGYTYDKGEPDSMAEGVTFLFVYTDDPKRLQMVIMRCQQKAAEMKN